MQILKLNLLYCTLEFSKFGTLYLENVLYQTSEYTYFLQLWHKLKIVINLKKLRHIANCYDKILIT